MHQSVTTLDYACIVFDTCAASIAGVQERHLWWLGMLPQAACLREHDKDMCLHNVV